MMFDYVTLHAVQREQVHSICQKAPLITCLPSPITFHRKEPKKIIFTDEFVPVNKIINTKDAYPICALMYVCDPEYAMNMPND